MGRDLECVELTGAGDRVVWDVMFQLYHPPHVRTAVYRRDHYCRELVCSPIFGNRGLWGWSIAINGTPPHGVLMLLGRNAGTRQGYYTSHVGRSRCYTWRSPWIETVAAFVERHLKNRLDPIEFTLCEALRIDPLPHSRHRRLVPATPNR